MSVIYTTRFKNDTKRVRKRGYDMRSLRAIIIKLHDRRKLGKKYKDHNLKGKMRGVRECRVEPNNDDWLIIYWWNKNLDLILERTGTHDDLFRPKKR